MQSLNEKTWAQLSAFGDDAPLCIKTTDSSIDGVRLIDDDEKSVPYVTRSDSNNGLARFVSPKNYEFGSDDGGCITVGLDTQTAFYQPHKFVTGQNIQVITGESLNEDVAQFMVPILRQQMTAKFNWGGNGATLGRMKRLTVMLPVTDSGEPDYAYMAEYAQQKRDAMLAKYRAYVEARIAELGEYVEISKLDEKEWRAFHLEEIGTVTSGRDIYATERIEGDMPYITSGGTNNGVGYFVGNINDTLDFGYIALNRNGAVGKAFYHPSKSLMGNDCRKVHLKDADKNLFVGQFVALCLSMQSGCFSYSRKLGTARAKRMQVMLPVTDSGEPDYEYMEQYAKNMMIRKYEQYLTFLSGKEQKS
ncbi:restriction enzyme BgcI subunit beta [Ligilactobacillus ruminis CAG:367]|jgi:hypothetical protein|nr:restriction enzyme BgcI subunit beta [Ligilactobacillus ruminis CAG:367]